MALSLRQLRRELRFPDALPRLRRIAYPEPAPEPVVVQLRLWIVDAEGLPPRPWRIPPDARFECKTLACRGMTVAACVARQQTTDAQRTQQRNRGQGSDFPHCDSRTCAQGRGLREALAADVEMRGSGPGGRFKLRSSGRTAYAAQVVARERMEREGRLDPVRMLDVDPDPATVEE